MLNYSLLMMFRLYSPTLHTITGNQQMSEHVGDQLDLCQVKYKLQLKIILNMPLFWPSIPIILIR